MLTLVGMSMVIFVLLRLAPGDIVDMLFSAGGYVDDKERAAILKELGLDKPVWAQYVEWIRQIIDRRPRQVVPLRRCPAWEVIRPLIPVTLELAVLSTARRRWCSASPLGVVSAVRQDAPLDYVVRGVQPRRAQHAVVLARHGDHPRAASSWLGWIPPVTYVPPSENWRLHAIQFALPALAVGYRSSALIMRITRSSLLEVMREDYIRTARAKGQGRAW